MHHLILATSHTRDVTSMLPPARRPSGVKALPSTRDGTCRRANTRCACTRAPCSVKMTKNPRVGVFVCEIRRCLVCHEVRRSTLPPLPDLGGLPVIFEPSVQTAKPRPSRSLAGAGRPAANMPWRVSRCRSAPRICMHFSKEDSIR